MHSDSRKAAIYFGQTVVSNALPLIALLVLTRFLTKEDFGTLALAQAYAVFASGIALLGMTEVFERGYFQHREDRHKLAALLYGVIGFALANYLWIAVLSYVFEGHIGAMIGFGHRPELVLPTLTGQFFAAVCMFYLLYFRNAGQAANYAWYMILASVLYFSGSIILVAYTGIGVVGVPLAQAASWVLVFVILTRRFVRELPLAFDRGVFAASLRLALPLTPRILISVVNTQIDKLMLGQLASVGSVGVYAIAQRIANFVFVFMTVLQNVFSPRVYTQMFEMEKGDNGAIGRYLSPFAYISILAALLVVVWAEEFVTLFLPIDFHAATNILIVLSMFFGSLFFGKVTGKQLMYAHRSGIISVLSLLGLGANILIVVPFVMWWGTLGAAWGTLLVGIITTGVSLVLAQRYFFIRWQFGRMAAMFFLLFLSGAGLLALDALSVSYTWRLGFKLGVLATYLYLGLRLGLVTVDSLRSLISAFRKGRIQRANP